MRLCSSGMSLEIDLKCRNMFIGKEEDSFIIVSKNFKLRVRDLFFF